MIDFPLVSQGVKMLLDCGALYSPKRPHPALLEAVRGGVAERVSKFYGGRFHHVYKLKISRRQALTLLPQPMERAA